MKNVRILQDFNYQLQTTDIVFNKDSYIVLVDNIVIGHFNLLFNIFGVKDKVSIDYELLESFRNKKYGFSFYQIIENYVVENFNPDEIILLVKYDNEKSKRIVEKNGFSVNYSYMEKINELGEMSNYITYSKTIEKENKKKLLK